MEKILSDAKKRKLWAKINYTVSKCKNKKKMIKFKNSRKKKLEKKFTPSSYKHFPWMLKNDFNPQKKLI